MTQALLACQEEMADLVKLVQQVHLDPQEQWLREKRFQGLLVLMVWMELLVSLDCLVPKEKWEQEEIWVLGDQLEKMDFKAPLENKARKEEWEILESLVNKAKKEIRELLARWDLLVYREHQDCLASLVSREYLACLEIKGLLAGREILVHQVLMARMDWMVSLECLGHLETEANLVRMEVLEFKE